MDDKIEEPAICHETALDEAFLVGTKDELAQFAKTILEMLDKPCRELDFWGIPAKQPDDDRGLTEVMSRVVLDGIVIVNSRDDRRKLINKLRVNNGELPIQWEEHDKRRK
ncbi:MAG: hypothetical protein AAF633_10490 [Chloroflexota bacterium]